MHRLVLGLLATTALATCGAEALAGNPAVNPPYPTPAPELDPWMGWYAGGNAGGSWGRAQSDFIISGFATSIAASDSDSPDGVIGGGQLGYNWQLNPNWLIGAEADIQASGETASSTRFDTVDFEGVTTNFETKIDWFGTVRGRLGYLFDRRTLLSVAWDPRWTWKVEYLYLDLGTLDAAVSSGLTTTRATTKFTDHVLRAGLNFHF
jgi:outer membrane immunogenic protein